MRRVLVACFLILCGGLAVYAAYEVMGTSAGQDPAAKDNTEQPGDMVCGPRCVQYLLKHYRQEEDLVELIREIQWPEFEAGASLQAIDDALRKRGVYTQAIKMDPRATLRWPHPALLHLNGSGSMGHYIVWLPESNEEIACAWVGLEGVRKGPNEKLARQISGTVLLTSPVPITSSAAEAVRDFSLFARLVSWQTGMVLLVSVVGGLLFSVGVHRLRQAGGRRLFLDEVFVGGRGMHLLDDRRFHVARTPGEGRGNRKR